MENKEPYRATTPDPWLDAYWKECERQCLEAIGALILRIDARMALDRMRQLRRDEKKEPGPGASAMLVEANRRKRGKRA